MKRYLKLLPFFLLVAPYIQAQDQPSLRLHIQGYNVVFPGIETAIEFPILQWELGKKKHNLKIVVAPVLDFFSYRGNYNGLGMVAELNPKITLESGWSYEIYGGIGLVNAFLSGTTYELQSDGSFSEQKAKSNQYLNLKAGFGVGKNISISNKQYVLSLRAGIREIRVPGYFLAPTTSIGVSIPLKSKNSPK